MWTLAFALFFLGIIGFCLLGAVLSKNKGPSDGWRRIFPKDEDSP